MTVPTINAVINFSTGPSFAQSMILGTGILGTNILADSEALIVDVSNQVDGVTTMRGRNAQADVFQTGTLTLRIVDQNGDFNPQNAAGPYYGLLTPLRKVQITGTYAGVDYPMFSGFITSYTTTTPKMATDVVYTTITAVDAFRLFQNSQISTVTLAEAGDLPGERVNAILDEIAWPPSMREIQYGDTIFQADPGTPRTALAALQTATISEYGALYINARGSVELHDRAFCIESQAFPVTRFNDDGTDINYFNAIWRLDDTQVYNSASITKIGGTAQLADDQTSIDQYFVHSYNQTNLVMDTNQAALDYARAYVASRKDTQTRCDLIELDLYMDDYNDGILAALSLDFFDPVEITTNQPGNSTLQQTLQVFGVTHRVTPNSWKTSFTTLEPIIDGFILDSTLYGVLDTSVLAYQEEMMAAGLGFKTFTTGEVLTAGDVNGYLMQGINVFTNAAARTAAITSPQEGQYSFLKDTNALEYYDGAAWVGAPVGDITAVTAGTGISGGGSSGDVTITNSMATAIDAKGDLVPGTGADTFARLAVGANGTVLTADSAETTGLKWATPSSGASYTQIDSQTMTGSQINFNSIAGTYNKLVLVCQDFYGTVGGETLKIRFNNDATANAYKTVGVFDGSASSGTATSGWFTWNFTGGTNQSNFAAFQIENYSNTNSWKSGIISAAYNNGTSDMADLTTVAWKNTSAITAINIFISNTTMAGGTAILWGVK